MSREDKEGKEDKELEEKGAKGAAVKANMRAKELCQKALTCPLRAKRRRRGKRRLLDEGMAEGSEAMVPADRVKAKAKLIN